jgi:hypothetical protein
MENKKPFEYEECPIDVTSNIGKYLWYRVQMKRYYDYMGWEWDTDSNDNQYDNRIFFIAFGICLGFITLLYFIS